MVINHGDEQLDGFRFAGGHPALDLCATVRGRLKASPVDALQTPGDLDRWLSASGLVVDRLEPEVTDLETARSLREAIYALAVAKDADEGLPADALNTLNRIAASPAAAAVLRPDSSAKLEGSARSLLGHLARAAVTLLSGQAGGAIRQCDGDGCAVLFHDKSRASARRWCSMSTCGNRSKATAFRRRDAVD